MSSLFFSRYFSKRVLACLMVVSGVAAAAAAESRTSPVYAEAGVGYLLLSGADYGAAAAQPATVRDDGGAWAPFVAVGYAFNERLGLRLSYSYAGDIGATIHRTYSDGAVPGEYWVNHQYSADVHVVTLAPEWTWRASDAVQFTFSPGLNWVSVREERLMSTNAPHILVIPRTKWNDDGFTFGASLGVVWAWTERWSLFARYRFVDVDPSWDRQGHALSSGVRWNF